MPVIIIIFVILITIHQSQTLDTRCSTVRWQSLQRIARKKKMQLGPGLRNNSATSTITAKQRHTLSSNTTPSTATPHPPQQCHTLHSNTTPSTATPHPPQQCHTLHSNATPSAAMPRSPQQRHTLHSNATPSTAMPHPPPQRHTLRSNATPSTPGACGTTFLYFYYKYILEEDSKGTNKLILIVSYLGAEIYSYLTTFNKCLVNKDNGLLKWENKCKTDEEILDKHLLNSQLVEWMQTHLLRGHLHFYYNAEVIISFDAIFKFEIYICYSFVKRFMRN